MFWQIWQNNRTKEIGLVTPTPDIESWGTCFQKIENVASKHTAMREKEIYEYLSAELRIKYVFNFLLLRPHHQKLNLGNIKAYWKSSVWFLSIEISHYQNQLDMSTAHRCLKSPQSLSGTPAHPTMVTLVNIMVILFVPCQSVVPFLRESYFKLWPWNFNSRVKVMGVVKGQGHTISPVSY